MEIETEKGLKQVLLYLEKADLVNAQKDLKQLYEHELGCEEVIYTDRCCTFWGESMVRLNAISNPYEKGQRLIAEWKSLTEFLSREKYVYEPARFSVQRGYFSSALEFYIRQMEEKDVFHRAEFYKNAGICYKKLGDFENA